MSTFPICIRVDVRGTGEDLLIPLHAATTAYAVVGFFPDGWDRQVVEWEQVHPADRHQYRPQVELGEEAGG
jgi:hypothetical protein